MSLHTKKELVSGLATVSFNEDTNTGVHSSAADTVSLMAGGVETVVATATGVAFPLGTILGGTSQSGAGVVSTSIIKKTAIADNTATDLVTVTVPNSNQSTVFEVLLRSTLTGANAYESTRVSKWYVTVARKTGANAVPAISLVVGAQIATVSGGATLTSTLTLGAVAGAVGATNTFTIKTTNVGSVAQVSETELRISELNGVASGVTFAAA